MRIAIGNDHRGYSLKCYLSERLTALGHVVEDCGSHSLLSADHPLYAQAVAEMVAAGEAELGILACGSGIGVSIAANKVPGIAAALITTVEAAKASRQHNGANIACFGADYLAPWYVEQCVLAFLATAV
ncbi:MAG: RpiB/LacA/LacB family sugar-phosphate isomerase, partial [bacterium]